MEKATIGKPVFSFSFLFLLTTTTGVKISNLFINIVFPYLIRRRRSAVVSMDEIKIEKYTTMEKLDAVLESDFFGGCEQYHYCSLYPNLKYTDAVVFLRNAGFSWLIDIIGTEINPLLSKAKDDFFMITLDVENSKATLRACTDIDDKNELLNVVYSKKINYTDAPAGRLRLYWQNGVLFAPCEY